MLISSGRLYYDIQIHGTGHTHTHEFLKTLFCEKCNAVSVRFKTAKGILAKNIGQLRASESVISRNCFNLLAPEFGI
jgi:hypothetical protein